MIRFADETMRDNIKDLWHDCFGDSNEYVVFFLDHYNISQHMLVFIDGDKPVSMLSLLPMSVVTKDGMTLNGRYIYAVATDPRYRGRGISTKLLEYTHDYLRKNGVRLSVLSPAKGELFNFYQKRGFESEFFIGSALLDESHIPPFTDSFCISEASQEEFSQIREAAFAGRFMFVRWGGEALAYRMAETAMLGGETLLLSAHDRRAVAVCHNEGDLIRVRELALDGMSPEDALGILHEKYHAREYALRLPMNLDCSFPLERSPLAMAYWYDMQYKQMVREGEQQDPYINLVLD